MAEKFVVDLNDPIWDAPSTIASGTNGKGAYCVLGKLCVALKMSPHNWSSLSEKGVLTRSERNKAYELNDKSGERETKYLPNNEAHKVALDFLFDTLRNNPKVKVIEKKSAFEGFTNTLTQLAKNSPNVNFEITKQVLVEGTTVGEFLKAEREKRSLSIGELSRLSGVAKSTISETENNIHLPKLTTLAKLVEALLDV